MTYWLRAIGIGAILGVMALVDVRGVPSELGGRLFSALNATLFLSIWIFVPLLTADTISREKREGTPKYCVARGLPAPQASRLRGESAFPAV